MSHIHNISGNQIASTEYQEYLARLSANLRAKRRAESGETDGLRTFDSAIEPDRDPDQEGGGEPEDEANANADGDGGSEPVEDTEGRPGWQAKA